jgi:hypothetical protein
MVHNGLNISNIGTILAPHSKILYECRHYSLISNITAGCVHE